MAVCVDSNYISDEARIVFSWYQLAVVFLLPAITMAYCYTFVVRVLWLSTKNLANLIQADRCADTHTPLAVDMSRIRGTTMPYDKSSTNRKSLTAL